MATNFPLVALYMCIWLVSSPRLVLYFHFFLCRNYYFLVEKGLEDNAAWPPTSPWLHYTSVYGGFHPPGRFCIFISFFVKITIFLLKKV